MNFSLRIRKFNHLFYLLFTKAEWCRGLMSQIGTEDKHLILMDFDNIELDTLVNYIKGEVFQYPTYILGDSKKNSYRVIMNRPISFIRYIMFLSNYLNRGLDYNFFRRTIQRGYGTIRITTKQGREPNKIIKVLNEDESKNIELSEFNTVVYETDSSGFKVKLEMK